MIWEQGVAGSNPAFPTTFPDEASTDRCRTIGVDSRIEPPGARQLHPRAYRRQSVVFHLVLAYGEVPDDIRQPDWARHL